MLMVRHDGRCSPGAGRPGPRRGGGRWRTRGAQVGILLGGTIGIVGPNLHPRGEVFDALNLVSWQEQRAELPNVKPLERRPLQAAVEKIQTVHVNPGFHTPPWPENAGAGPFGPAPRPATEATGETRK